MAKPSFICLLWVICHLHLLTWREQNIKTSVLNFPHVSDCNNFYNITVFKSTIEAKSLFLHRYSNSKTSSPTLTPLLPWIVHTLKRRETIWLKRHCYPELNELTTKLATIFWAALFLSLTHTAIMKMMSMSF